MNIFRVSHIFAFLADNTVLGLYIAKGNTVVFYCLNPLHYKLNMLDIYIYYPYFFNFKVKEVLHYRTTSCLFQY